MNAVIDALIDALNVVLPFVGVIVGARIARQNELERQRKDRLITAYSCFFEVYCETILEDNATIYNFRRLYAAGERIKLICCPEALKSVEKIMDLIAKNELNAISEEIANLRRIAREELI